VYDAEAKSLYNKKMIKFLRNKLYKLEDEMVEEAMKRTYQDDNEEIILLRVKLECRSMFMRFWQTIASGLFTGLTVTILSICITIFLKVVLKL
jgi:hypothetical protein